MNIFFLGIIVFLVVLAVFDLAVGVSNDAVNFLNSAIGAKVARFRTIMIVAAVGIFAGATMSNGMMDVARHGIMTPEYFSFYDVMCVFLAVMVTDVILLDVFNTLGMPTSTTVSLVFELLGGAFAIAIIKILNGAVSADGTLLTLGDLLNTEKALSVVLGIFLSVAIAFVLGMLVQWVSRVVFTFSYRVNGTTTGVDASQGGLTASSIKIGLFCGVAITGLVWFLLINGLKNSAFMTSELKDAINANVWQVIMCCFLLFSLLMTMLSVFKVPVLKIVILFGTFALAMAFAGNDLVNFVGVPLTGLDAYMDYSANGGGNASAYLMESLMESAQTPTLYLVLAGIVMVLSLMFSKKARNVVKTSVDLSRQDEGDEMFGSSGVARVLVRNSQKISSSVYNFLPVDVRRWIDSRFDSDATLLVNGAAFDQVRAAVNLVLAGALVAFGTSMKLPLSTTYVTFMVAMGTSLADRAWGRENAVFRITGVISVIGGWFITAGVAFFICFLMTNGMFFGSFVFMAISIVAAIYLIVRSNMKFSSVDAAKSVADSIFSNMMHSADKAECWNLLVRHVCHCNREQVGFVGETYRSVTDAFLGEEYRPLRRAVRSIDESRKLFKRNRKREIVGLRRIDPVLAMEKNTWYFLANNAVEQMLYCLKRINDPCLEHVGNNFFPVDDEYTRSFLKFRSRMVDVLMQTESVLAAPVVTDDLVADGREQAEMLQKELSRYRKSVIRNMQSSSVNIESATVFLNIIQESEQILSCVRHLLRGTAKFCS